MIYERLRKVDEFWAWYFGCSPEDFNESKTLVLPHAALQGYEGILAFRHDPSCIVSVPATMPEVDREKLRGASPDRAFDPDLLAKSFGVWQDPVVSPRAWVGVCEPTGFKPAPSTARLLTADDSKAIRRLAEGCGEVAWNSIELVIDSQPTFGIFIGKELVAASRYVNMEGVLAYIGVVTHPQHRGKGYAKAVASASMEFALDRDLVPMWRTVASNEAAVAVARSLGFRPYAFTIDVQPVADEF